MKSLNLSIFLQTIRLQILQTDGPICRQTFAMQIYIADFRTADIKKPTFFANLRTAEKQIYFADLKRADLFCTL